MHFRPSLAKLISTGQSAGKQRASCLIAIVESSQINIGTIPKTLYFHYPENFKKGIVKALEQNNIGAQGP